MPDMQLPRYNKNSISIENNDFESIVNIRDIDALSMKIYGCAPADISPNTIKQFLAGEAFKKGADYSENETDNNKLVSLISEIHKVAKEAGFPGKLMHNSAQFDILLAKKIYTLCEELEIQCRPSEINGDELQAFATQRIFPLIAFWRWSHNEIINESRIRPGVRNYFYTLLMTAWLFDTQVKDESERWKYLSVLSADIIVAIIERPGIGYRRGFAHAVAEEILRRKSNQGKQNMDRLVRGVMKRATFTFSVAVMPDEPDYYREIIMYLFDWSENNYIEAFSRVSEDTEEYFGNNRNITSEGLMNNNIVGVSDDVLENKYIISGHEEKQFPNFGLEDDFMNIPDYWFAMAKWAKENDYFDGSTRKFIFQLGILIKSKKELTSKQIIYKSSVQTQAKALGFDDIILKDVNFIRKNEDQIIKKNFKFYLKKLTANELGYRNGKMSNGMMLYISKQAADFFPPLSREKINDCVVLEVYVEYRSQPLYLNMVYHNDKFSRSHGTKDEYRIYLNREISQDEFFFQLNDIVLFERIDTEKYILKIFKEGNSDFDKLNELINRSTLKGHHALVHKI